MRCGFRQRIMHREQCCRKAHIRKADSTENGPLAFPQFSSHPVVSRRRIALPTPCNDLQASLIEQRWSVSWDPPIGLSFVARTPLNFIDLSTLLVRPDKINTLCTLWSNTQNGFRAVNTSLKLIYVIHGLQLIARGQ